MVGRKNMEGREGGKEEERKEGQEGGRKEEGRGEGGTVNIGTVK